MSRKPKLVRFNIHNGSSIEELDKKFEKAYENANPKSLFLVFDLTNLSVLSMELLMDLVPLINKYKEDAREKNIQSFVIIETAWIRGLLGTFLAMPFVNPAAPVSLVGSMSETLRCVANKFESSESFQ